jgi:hypothetical protein
LVLNGYAAGGAAAPSLGDTLRTSSEQLEELANMVRVVWGSGELVAAVVPHFGDDLQFCARYERMGARPIGRSSPSTPERANATPEVPPNAGSAALAT